LGRVETGTVVPVNPDEGQLAVAVAREKTAPPVVGDERRRSIVDASTVARLPGILLGIGLGGFVDGIVLHQMLQWHHMLTSEGSYPDTTVAGLETNILWDGIFHAATWVTVLAGLWMLWQRSDSWSWGISGRAFVGWMLVGWGLFNVVEGIVDHHLLTIHHVREGVNNQWVYDVAFLVFGAALIIGGWLFVRSEERRLRTTP
jgi:uncharacterized membrane protein